MKLSLYLLLTSTNKAILSRSQNINYQGRKSSHYTRRYEWAKFRLLYNFKFKPINTRLSKPFYFEKHLNSNFFIAIHTYRSLITLSNKNAISKNYMFDHLMMLSNVNKTIWLITKQIYLQIRLIQLAIICLRSLSKKTINLSLPMNPSLPEKTLSVLQPLTSTYLNNL